MAVTSLISTLKVEQKRYDDDFADRLNNRVTVIILIVYALVATGQLYYGSPMTCWMPAHYHGSWKKFTNSLCWVNDTYYVPLHDDHPIPKAHEIKDHQRIQYYQWIPFILMAQAFLFYAPSHIWRALNSKSGIDSDNILECAHKLSRCTDLEKRSQRLLLIRTQMHYFVSNTRLGRPKSRLLGVLRKCRYWLGSLWAGGYLIMLYIAVKVLYILNVFLQLYVLSHVLNTDFSLFGLDRFMNKDEAALEEERFMNNSIFPKVTMCDVHVRQLGNNIRETLQCVLPVNLFTERFYAFFWWWLVFVLMCTSVNLLAWLIRTLLSYDRLGYIRTHLVRKGKVPRKKYADDDDNALVKEFTYSYLRQDGVFLCRMIGHNTDTITLDEILGELWDSWRKNQQLNDPECVSILYTQPDSIRKRPNGRAMPNGQGHKPVGHLQRVPSVPSPPPLKLDTVDGASC